MMETEIGDRERWRRPNRDGNRTESLSEQRKTWPNQEKKKRGDRTTNDRQTDRDDEASAGQTGPDKDKRPRRWAEQHRLKQWRPKESDVRTTYGPTDGQWPRKAGGWRAAETQTRPGQPMD